MLHQQKDELAESLHIGLLSDFLLPAAEFFKSARPHLVFTRGLLLGFHFHDHRLEQLCQLVMLTRIHSYF